MFRSRHPNKRWRRRFVELRTDHFRTFSPLKHLGCDSFSRWRRSKRKSSQMMSGKHFKAHEVSCCIKYFIFGFNIIFWVSPPITSTSTTAVPALQACFQDILLFSFSVKLWLMLLFLGCRLLRVKGNSDEWRRTCLLIGFQQKPLNHFSHRQ